MKRRPWPFAPKRMAGIETAPGNRVSIRWEDGGRSLVDLSPWIARVERTFPQFADPAFFASGVLSEDRSFVVWIEDEIAIDSIHLQLLEAEQRGTPLLPDALKRWRERNGLTQTAAAKALGVSPRMYQHYEAGENFVPWSIALACKGYDALQEEAA